MTNLMNSVIDGQHPLMAEKENSLKVLRMSRKAFDMYTNHIRALFPREEVKERYFYRGIDIEVFESDEIYISISMKTPKKDYNTNDYHKYFFDAQVQGGYTTTHYNGLVNLHQNGAQWLYDQGVRTAFEIGSGLGFFLQAAKNVGIQAKGYDINPYEREFAISKGIDPDTYILGVPDQFGIDGEYDAFYSVEVFEHIVDETLIPLVEQIAEKGKYFFFTSTPNYTTPEADEAWGHINIKPVEDWIQFFQLHGLKFHSLNKTVCTWGIVMTGKRYEL